MRHSPFAGAPLVIDHTTRLQKWFISHRSNIMQDDYGVGNAYSVTPKKVCKLPSKLGGPAEWRFGYSNRERFWIFESILPCSQISRIEKASFRRRTGCFRLWHNTLLCPWRLSSVEKVISMLESLHLKTRNRTKNNLTIIFIWHNRLTIVGQTLLLIEKYFGSSNPLGF
jgi:hypothetical protein